MSFPVFRGVSSCFLLNIFDEFRKVHTLMDGEVNMHVNTHCPESRLNLIKFLGRYSVQKIAEDSVLPRQLTNSLSFDGSGFFTGK